MNDVKWTNSEFEGASFADKRLNERLLNLAKSISKGPSLPLNQVSDDWASVKASYRFFDNEKVTPQKIIEPHINNTVRRCLGHKYILVIQDTTIINYTRHQKTKGLGKIGGKTNVKHPNHGIVMHSSIALSPSGVPLGVLNNYIWSRKEKDKIHSRLLEFNDRESSKWVSAYDDYSNLLEKKVPSITIADREADFSNLFLTIQDKDDFYIVRSFHNRNIGDRYNVIKMHESIKKRKPFETVVTIKVPIKDRSGPIKKDRKKYSKNTSYRNANVRVSLQEVTLAASRKLNEPVREPVPLRHIYLEEIDPPIEGEKVEWHLVTNLDVKTFEDCWEDIQAYRLRWSIETFFKVLKSSCKIEDCRLSESRRLEKFISLKSVIAWRLLWLTYVTKENPKAPCSSVLRQIEWQTLYKRIHKKDALPKAEPTVKEVNIWIARLGGYLNRNSDGPPGILSIWKGWLRLQDMVSIQEITS